jgi:NADPH:quinone reductase-like Zn-dependent oxidoreductase
VLRALPVTEKTAITNAFVDKVLPHVRRRTLLPLIHRVYPLAEAAAAHEEMEASRHFGKIVLSVATAA